MYKPLPAFLTIKRSSIHGLGLYATSSISAGFVLGITHVKDDRFENGYIRTPMGGFFNHSENPNCEVVATGDYILLITLRVILAEEEITARYTLYTL